MIWYGKTLEQGNTYFRRAATTERLHLAAADKVLVGARELPYSSFEAFNANESPLR